MTIFATRQGKYGYLDVQHLHHVVRRDDIVVLLQYVMNNGLILRIAKAMSAKQG